MFLQGTSAPQACWTIIGIGIRMAQDVGAHRRKVYSTAPTVEEELWRRAFWVLVAMDRQTSFALGRPCAIQDEECVPCSLFRVCVCVCVFLRLSSGR